MPTARKMAKVCKVKGTTVGMVIQAHRVMRAAITATWTRDLTFMVVPPGYIVNSNWIIVYNRENVNHKIKLVDKES